MQHDHVSSANAFVDERYTLSGHPIRCRIRKTVPGNISGHLRVRHQTDDGGMPGPTDHSDIENHSVDSNIFITPPRIALEVRPDSKPHCLRKQP